MSAPIDLIMQWEFRERVIKRAVTNLVWIVPELLRRMIDDQGLAPGDVPLSRDQRIMKAIDNAASGNLDRKMIIAPRQAQRQMTQLKADLVAAGVEFEE